MSTTDASVIVPISTAHRPATAAAAASERMKLAMKVGALSSNSANASTVVIFALLSITSMVDARGDTGKDMLRFVLFHLRVKCLGT
jgi:hypothetical protein